ncbi:DUF4062 domain-containing protein [Burkholderia anthina]|uniref:DUF4062 domain-containing protein n=1 Tax=Burkholderia anthina TaxID=179879 RepID=A0AAW3PZR2_9BURK|nr:DUF4062 domain-containing protein [Burkholderia anthina]KWZ35076.1 hypothetical protein WS64_05720 [Burkholderia anthina]
MDKRYQVFVSSTYADLLDERQEVMQALLELDCIPAGMELFPAANEDQWTLIKKVIDDCDYYMVIIAGRYGSIGPDGLSYTEMEYRYALETGKPVLGFVHRDPTTLPAKRCEAGEEGKAKLEAFRALAQKKLCRFWESPADLGSQVSRSLVKLIKSSPAVGWVRGNLVPEQSATEEILSLRRQIEDLQAELQATRTTGPAGTAELAQGADEFKISYRFIASPSRWAHDGTTYKASITTGWDEIFAALSPLMIHEAAESALTTALDKLVRHVALPILQKDRDLKGLNILDVKAEAEDFQTIKVQLRALGLITQSTTKNRSVKDKGSYWTLTPYGDTVMTRLRAIKKP